MEKVKIDSTFNEKSDVILYQGDCLDLLSQIPNKFVKLVVTSPPYNLGKSYESRTNLDQYLAQQQKVIKECVRILDDRGSICWEVGNYVDNSEVVPLDILLYPIFASLELHLRNRIVWHFGHGLHASKRFSGRYEVILWFTKGNDYTFNLNSVRVPQKYPNKKYFKGPKRGCLSGNPLGKNPGDIWEIPNVKSNHVEKTIHPCQFPVELIERLVLAMTNEGERVLDPFIGVGTTAIAALMHKRKAIGAEIKPEYIEIAKERILLAEKGALRIRPMERPVFNPNTPHSNVPPHVVNLGSNPFQPQLSDQIMQFGAKEQKE
ncbi:MAG: site-specific DNA-methyltransferase [Actinobacteria bacterium]|nr:site-specific DNA-methyltransferase [Actinomycetota bacterium]